MTQKATVTRNTEKVSTGPNIKVMRFRVNTKNILNAHKLKSEANADKPNKFQEGAPSGTPEGDCSGLGVRVLTAVSVEGLRWITRPSTLVIEVDVGVDYSLLDSFYDGG